MAEFLWWVVTDIALPLLFKRDGQHEEPDVKRLSDGDREILAEQERDAYEYERAAARRSSAELLAELDAAATEADPKPHAWTAAETAEYNAYLDTLPAEEKADALAGEYTIGDHAECLRAEREMATERAEHARATAVPTTTDDEIPF